jgi:hypothetical protein
MDREGTICRHTLGTRYGKESDHRIVNVICIRDAAVGAHDNGMIKVILWQRFAVSVFIQSTESYTHGILY